MRVGSLKIYTILILLFLITNNLNAQEKVNLNILQPTFEEEPDSDELKTEENSNKIKSKEKKRNLSGESIVKIRALDKITAKTKDLDIIIGKKKRFGYLEILPKKCSKFEDQSSSGVAVYIQVKDLSDKKEDKIFVFNGWTFSTSTNLKTFDHPIYDLWVTGCENI